MLPSNEAKYKEQGGSEPDTGALAGRTEREYSAAETDLMLSASRFADMVEKAAEELAPHRVCQYIYELSNAFNSFYHENRIVVEEDSGKQVQWFALIALVLRILGMCTDLLGFEVPDRM